MANTAALMITLFVVEGRSPWNSHGL